ncbi:MAG: phage holin family protein [Dysgonomonas sp.]
MLNNSERDESLNTLLDQIKKELLCYINRRMRLIKLDAFEKGGIITSALGYGLIVLLIVGILLFFSLIGLAFFIGELLNNTSAGFGILALFSLLVLIIVLLNGKRIKRAVLYRTIAFFRKLDVNDEE